MMTREEVLAVIDAGYAARMAGDAAALSRFWAPDATFEFAGDPALLAGVPGGAGPEQGQASVETLMGFVAMSGVERLHAVVEGDRAATIARATITVAERPPFETLLFDYWQFDETGRVRSLLQFADTARIAVEWAAMNR